MTKVCGKPLMQLRLIASTCPHKYGQRQVYVHTIVTLPQGNYHTYKQPRKHNSYRDKRSKKHLSAGFLTEVLVVAFHQLALHIQIQRLLQRLLAPDVQTQLYQTNKLVKLLSFMPTHAKIRWRLMVFCK